MSEKKKRKNATQQRLYAMPCGTLRIARTLCGIKKNPVIIGDRPSSQ